MTTVVESAAETSLGSFGKKQDKKDGQRNTLCGWNPYKHARHQVLVLCNHVPLEQSKSQLSQSQYSHISHTLFEPDECFYCLRKKS